MGKAVVNLNTPNKTQNFWPSDDNWRQELFTIKASTAYAAGQAMGIEIVANTTTGALTSMGVANATGADFVGILVDAVTASDPDYATAGKQKLVWVPNSPYARAYFTVISGTFTTAVVNRTVQFAAGSLGLNVGTIGLGARVRRFITSTRGECDFSVPATQTA